MAPWSPALARLGLLLAAAAAVSCADETVVVKYAPGFAPGPATVSVLGIFRDGRMSADAWGALGPALSGALNAPLTCEPAFGEQLARKDAELYSSIDDETRQNGITEDLLARVAPKAQGDLILTITIHGTVATAGGTSPTDPSQQSSQGNAPPIPRGGLGSGRGGGRGQQGGGRGMSPVRTATKALELSASLYSVRAQKPVARLNMSYTGTSAEDAVRTFGARVATMMPGSTCRGWTFLDEKRPAGDGVPATVIPSTEGP